jgi:glucose-6-phosphate 1-dehydrogenase
MKKPDNHILVIFGASGDLTYRKLIPAVYDLFRQNLLPEKFAILGVSRTEISDEKFRDKMKDGIKIFANFKEDDDKIVDNFLQHLSYFTIDTESKEHFRKLKNHLEKMNSNLETGNNAIYYLSTPPTLYGVIPTLLGEVGLNTSSNGSWKKLIIEKPFGYDLASALELNKKLSKYFREEQIYRIDHYLGKESVQNILVTRFSNGVFEPLWNRNYVHHVEITSVENIGIENRGGYYDSSGAMRDMVQNHLLQLTGLIAMEPPSSFDSNAIRNEIVKVFQSFRPFSENDISKNSIRGQYTSATVKGEKLIGYREEKGIGKDSRTESYVAMKVFIDNWRWGGVPFYIRSGKRLPTKVTEVVINFKPTPHFLFSKQDINNSCNQIVLRIQPDEGVLLKVGMKVPGQGFNVQTVNLDFHYSDLSHSYLPTAYERLLHDCMIGDSTLYQRADAVESAWKFVDPILDAWKNDSNIPIYGYPAGTWGPEKADNLLEEKGLTWRYPCKNLAEDGIYCEL